MTDRVLVIGLDSAPLKWVQRWIDEGRMPNLGPLIRGGATGILRSVSPPLSPAAWSSFATGLLPERHGVFDHIYRRPASYDIAPTSAQRRAGSPIWRLISDQEGRVGVINVPETFPPEPVNGFLISGMDTPGDQAEFAYPPGLKAELDRAVGGYRVFGPRSKENLDRSIAGMYETIPMRCRTGAYLWSQYHPDLMILVFMETDVIQHKCWKYMDPAHPEYSEERNRQYGGAIADIYSLVDRELKPLLDRVDDRTTVIIMSDHGAGPLHAFLYQNNWLVRQGLMRFKQDAVSTAKHLLFNLGLTPENIFDAAALLRLGIVDRSTDRIKSQMSSKGQTTAAQRLFLSWTDVDWQRTRAYTLGGNTTGFYINLKGREPQGCVEPGTEYEQLRDEIIDRLAGWQDPGTGIAIVDRAMRREEVYEGVYADRAPDVVFTTRGEAYVGFGGHEFANKHLLHPSRIFNGHHRVDGMVALWGRDVVQNAVLPPHRIVDLAPTILHLLGYPVPAGLDGKVMLDALDPQFLAEHPARENPQPRDGTPASPKRLSGDDGAESAQVYSSEEEKAVMERLRELGYA